jgi:hypothetical protein
MNSHLHSLPFDEWIVHVFDHEVRQPEWYFDLDAPVWSAPSPLTLQYLTRLFNDPLTYVASYTDEEVNQGLWYLVSNAASNHMFALTDESVAPRSRVECVRSFLPLFEKLFAPRCSEHLSHKFTSRSQTEANPLNESCYMWWDFISFIGFPDPPTEKLNDTALSVMEEICCLESTACRESALHGLGHWQPYCSVRVGEIIDRILSNSSSWTAELTTYAGKARAGCVQ